MDNNSRIYHSIKNISYGVISTGINTFISFISRTIFVKILGAEYLGLNGLFTEVIAMLSLAELGVGMAIVYNLYEPLHNQNQKRICQLMCLYKTAYTLISCVTFFAGMALLPVIDRLVTDVDFSVNYIRFVFMLFVIRTSSSYLFSYKTSLLNADQKQYIVSFVNMAVKSVITIASIILLLISQNYIVYLSVLILQNLIANIIISKYVDMHYPYLDYHLKMEKDERNAVFDNIKNIFMKRVSGVITESTDNILISKLVSTVQAGYYSNYVMVLTAFKMLKNQLTSGMAASIGDLYVSEDGDYSENILRKLTYVYFCFSCISCISLFSVINLFIFIWLGKEYVMDEIAVYIVIFNLSWTSVLNHCGSFLKYLACLIRIKMLA